MCLPPSQCNSAAFQTKAKYGDESVYFDLGDVEATTGAWDVYGDANTVGELDDTLFTNTFLRHIL